ncbi:hypothetical protein [Hymenobacter sp. B81]|uniref:hypothetical protein n=1 Tax=Hymenobacter sp. B81 TaxID=3344878 RepID=UPI0037DCE5CC
MNRLASLLPGLGLLLALAAAAPAAAQPPARHALYLEAGGRGPYYSLNYERRLRPGARLQWALSVGAAVLPDEVALPLGLTALTHPQGAHHAALGLSVTPAVQHYRTLGAREDYSDKLLYLAPGLGYRYQRPLGGLLLAVGATPLWRLDPPSYDPWDFSVRFYPSGHLAVGWGF